MVKTQLVSLKQAIQCLCVWVTPFKNRRFFTIMVGLSVRSDRLFMNDGFVLSISKFSWELMKRSGPILKRSNAIIFILSISIFICFNINIYNLLNGDSKENYPLCIKRKISKMKSKNVNRSISNIHI